MNAEPIRCPWCLGDPDYIRYHDEEWGRPVYDDRKLFEFLVLESAQAGLSWLTILRKREGYRKAFRSEEHTSELQSLMRISYAVFCLKTTKQPQPKTISIT